MVVPFSSVNMERLKDENVEVACCWTHVLTYMLENDVYLVLSLAK